MNDFLRKTSLRKETVVLLMTSRIPTKIPTTFATYVLKNRLIFQKTKLTTKLSNRPYSYNPFSIKKPHLHTCGFWLYLISIQMFQNIIPPRFRLHWQEYDTYWLHSIRG